MLLVLDVGNTNTVMGIFEGKKLIDHWRLTSRKQTADEVGFMILGLLSASGISKEMICASVYASVVPSLDEMFMEGIKNYVGVPCLKVSQDLDTGVKVRMKNPAGLGADRLLNAVAGVEKYGAPLVIVDLGTAITLDVISADGAYVGGTIAPGMELGMESLFSRTAKLPQISLEAPGHYIGGDTTEAIQSGIVYGTVGLVEALLRGVFKELGGPCRVVATGGHASILARHSDIVKEVDPWLTIEGLRIIYERNRFE
ncbi:MAG: Type III pantothenate kinase [Synergistaceae bacterium]|nr:type III pantothenate kinase [Synergistaceae bacterium]